MPKETVLILDRESHTRWVLKALLENEEYLVIAVEAMGRALQNFSEFEVSGLITEYRIDQSSTLDMIRELKTRSPEAYVMMLTADEVTEKEYEEIISAGVDDYFVKPFPSWKILPHLRKGLKQRSLVLHKKRLEQEFSRMKGKGEESAAPHDHIEEKVEGDVAGNTNGERRLSNSKVML
jgi:DNA-binding NtrC family response regulator